MVAQSVKRAVRLKLMGLSGRLNFCAIESPKKAMKVAERTFVDNGWEFIARKYKCTTIFTD